MKPKKESSWPTAVTIATGILFGLFIWNHAKAMEMELGIGQTHFSHTPNGTWWQQGFPYKLDMSHLADSIGMTGRINSWLRWHTDYESLGRASENSWDTPSDANYSITTPNHCNGTCLPLANYVGSGSIRGIALTLAPEYRIADDLRFFVNAGPFLYRSSWNEQVYNWFGTTVYLNHKTRWEIGEKIGLGIRNHRFGIEYDWYPCLHTTGDSIPSLYTGAKVLRLEGYFS